MSKKQLLLIFYLLLTLSVGFLGGFYFDKRRVLVVTPVQKEVTNREQGKPISVDFSTFWQVWNLLQDKYVDKGKLDAQELVYGAIDGLTKAAGDPYTVFFKPKDSENFADEINGSFGGIGIEIGLKDNILTVIAPLKGTPAEKAGILSGDKIIKIGDKISDGIKLSEAVGLIRGPAGTPVKLSISRDKLSDVKEFNIIRSTIKIPSAAWELKNDNTAYLQVFVFNKNIDSEFRKVATEITKSKADRIILDLRNNPGGLLDSAVNLAGYFLDSDKAVTIEKFGDNTQNIYKTKPNGSLKNYPLVILINKGSASASEILAGALKDNRNIPLIGEKSFGKGSVQEVDDLPRKASVKITIAKWFTPNNISINENGINPDIEILLSEDDIKNKKDPQLDKALEVIKGLNVAK